MSATTPHADETLIARALAAARDTRALHVGPGARHVAADHFAAQFGAKPAVVVADANTFADAGRDVVESFRRKGHTLAEPFVFGESPYADEHAVEQLQGELARRDGIPIAVGSGTINDLTTLAAHRLGRRYMSVATAASMDGYTAYGASITAKGLKQTFDCPAPLVVSADVDVIASAPKAMTASGYADLMAKTAAGADWIVADALGVEPIDGPAWEFVQSRLRGWLAEPARIAAGDPDGLRRLTTGLMMGGFAMQRTQTSRPASGAEHQFSHLWDMQHHTHAGRAPSHGFKVGIGTLASVALYEQLLALPLETLDVGECCRQWGDDADVIAATFDSDELIGCARQETAAKHVTAEQLREQLLRLREVWPGLRERLKRHLPSFGEVRRMLADAGCPTQPEEIGIGRHRLRASYRQAYFIRRRFTVLDLARRTGTFDACVDSTPFVAIEGLPRSFDTSS